MGKNIAPISNGVLFGILGLVGLFGLLSTKGVHIQAFSVVMALFGLVLQISVLLYLTSARVKAQFG